MYGSEEGGKTAQDKAAHCPNQPHPSSPSPQAEGAVGRGEWAVQGRALEKKQQQQQQQKGGG